MQLLFIDESNPPVPRLKLKIDSVPHFVLAGFSLHESEWTTLSQTLNKSKRKFDVIGEVKWRWFSPDNTQSQNTLLHLNADQRAELRLKILDSLASVQSARVFATSIDQAQYYERHHSHDEDDLYNQAFQLMSERFQDYLQDLTTSSGQEQFGIIVCDQRNSRQDRLLREFHHGVLRGKQKHTQARYSRLIEGVFMTPSEQSVGVQIADIVAGAVFRSLARGDQQFLERIRHLLRPEGQS